MTALAACQQAVRAALEQPARNRPDGAAGQPRLLVAFSGGLDSSVLLHATASIAPQRTLAIHVNHGLHPQADAWQRHCERVCAAAGIELTIRQLSLAPGVGATPAVAISEARARDARYSAFAEVLQAGDTLLLAHHADDLAESVLLHVLQGRGTYGMPRQRPFAAGQLLRPLLSQSQAELRAYADLAQLQWVEDSSNHDARFDRNFLRHQIMPLLQRRFAQLPTRLSGVAAQADQLRALAMEGWELDTSLAISQLRSVTPEAAVALLQLWLSARGAGSVSRRALKDFLRQLDSAGERQPSLQLCACSVRRYRGALHLVRPGVEPPASCPLGPPARLELPHGTLTVVENSAGMIAAGGLYVAFRQPGARIRSAGHHRRVKKLFQAAAVPPWQRQGYPLLYDDEGLLAVPAIATRDHTENPRYRLSVTWDPAAEPMVDH